MSSQPSSCWIHIPDTLASWPWSRKINVHYETCNAETLNWIESFGASVNSVREAYYKSEAGLLAALTYPFLDKEGCRIGSELMSLFLFIDEKTDKGTADVVQSQADIILNAFRNPHIPRPGDEWIGGEIARQFWLNAIRSMTPIVQRRFIDVFQEYLEGVIEQAKDRTTHHCRTVESYFEVRRKTVGAKPSFVPNEINLDIPDHIMKHPVIEKLTIMSVDMILIENDLVSYNREQARGDDTHNLITVAMREFGIDVQAAIDWVGDYHERIVNQFLDEWHNIPIVTLGLSEQACKDVQTYCESLALWVRGHSSWCFECQRYFGKVGLEIQNTRRVQLLPKVHSTTSVNGNGDI